jgi:plasmid stabilization system protein ParE
MDYKVIWSDAAISDLYEIDVSEPLGTVEILHVRHGARDEPQM